MKQFKPRSFK